MPFKTASISINFDTHWSTYQRPTNMQAPRPWRQWLLDRSSLTQHLITASKGQFKVELIQQQWAFPSASEARVLGLKNRQLTFIREVKLIGNDHVYVLARTIIPMTTLSGRHKQLSSLGNRSLGSVLFRDPSMRRGTFQISRLRLNNQQSAWARRSVFYLDNKPLLVCEAFLPHLATTDYAPSLLPKVSR